MLSGNAKFSLCARSHPVFHGGFILLLVGALLLGEAGIAFASEARVEIDGTDMGTDITLNTPVNLNYTLQTSEHCIGHGVFGTLQYQF